MHGKDAPPEETIAQIRRIVRQYGFSPEDVSWRHPAPGVWSVHVRERRAPCFSVNGKGTTRSLALASALGEYMERLVTGYFFSDHGLRYVPPQGSFFFAPDERWSRLSKKGVPPGVLTPRLGAFYDPLKELRSRDLVDRMSLRRHTTEICSLPFERVGGTETVYFPISLLDNLYASNGMAAGNTKTEACVQALAEIIERYVKTIVIRTGIALPDIPRKAYGAHAHINTIIATLKRAGYRVLVKDASLGGRYPVVNVTIVQRQTKKCFLAFGAHPSFEIALTRTLTELLQGQTLSGFKGLRSPRKNKAEVRDAANILSHFIDSSGLVSREFFTARPAYPYMPFDLVGTRREEEHYLLSIFRRAKKEVYIRAVAIDGFSVVRIIVPGWSEVYPVEDLVCANNNKGRFFFAPLMDVSKATKVTHAGLQTLRRVIEDGSAGEQEIALDLLGIVADEGSPWERLCLGELRLRVLLALKDHRAAHAQVQWCLDVGCLPRATRETYLCLERIYERAPLGGFSPQAIRRAKGIMRGENVFRGLFTKNGQLRGTVAHAKIENAFKKRRRMMARCEYASTAGLICKRKTSMN